MYSQIKSQYHPLKFNGNFLYANPHRNIFWKIQFWTTSLLRIEITSCLLGFLTVFIYFFNMKRIFLSLIHLKLSIGKTMNIPTSSLDCLLLISVHFVDTTPGLLLSKLSQWHWCVLWVYLWHSPLPLSESAEWTVFFASEHNAMLTTLTDSEVYGDSQNLLLCPSEDKDGHFSCWNQGSVSSWNFKLDAMPEWLLK